MRGFLEEGNTLLMLIFAITLLVIASFIVLLGVITHPLTGIPKISEEFEVESIKAQSYALAEVASHLRLADRNIFEQLIETATSGLDDAGARQMPLALMDTARYFEFIDLFEFKLVKNDKVLFTAGNIETRCGENDEGFCIYDAGYANVCDTGRVVIPDKGVCAEGTLCCKYDPQEYVAKKGKNKIVPCGRTGICAEWGSGGFSSVNPEAAIGSCNIGMTPVSDGDKTCKGTNDGRTPVCCASLETLFTEPGRERIATVPLLYRGPALFEPKQYQCQSIFSRCDGEYVSGLCESAYGENVQCCVTDIIRCKPPNSKYLCRDAGANQPAVEHCPTSAGLIGDENSCPKPDNYRCCKIEKPPKIDQNTLEEPENKGPCFIDGTPYYDKVSAELEVTVFERER